MKIQSSYNSHWHRLRSKHVRWYAYHPTFWKQWLDLVWAYVRLRQE